MGGGGTQTVEKSANPWVGQQEYLKDVFAQAQKQYNQPGPLYYPGQTVAGQSPATIQAQQAALEAAGAQAGTARGATQASNFLLNSYDVNNNPALTSAIEAAQRPVINAFYDPGGPLAQTRQDAIAANQYGGSRQGVAQGVAEGRLADTLGGISASMANQAYQSGLDASGRALALAPTTQQTQLQPSITQDIVGQAQRQYEQELINSAIQQWNYQQTLPAQKLAQYQNLVQGSYGGTGSETMPAARGNPALGAVGGAATGYALASMAAIPGAGWVALAGALLGGLASR